MMAPIADPPITVLVSRVVLPVNREAFERAMRDLTELSTEFFGHLGVSVFRPGVGEAVYRIVFKFDSKSHFDLWQASSDVAGLIARVDALTEGEPRVDTLTGLEAWFTLPGVPSRPPPRPKMAAVTWAALFPLVSLLLTVLQPVIARVPFLVGTLIVTGLVTLLMTYVIMPRLTRMLAPWLFGRGG